MYRVQPWCTISVTKQGASTTVLCMHSPYGLTSTAYWFRSTYTQLPAHSARPTAVLSAKGRRQYFAFLKFQGEAEGKSSQPSPAQITGDILQIVYAQAALHINFVNSVPDSSPRFSSATSFLIDGNVNEVPEQGQLQVMPHYLNTGNPPNMSGTHCEQGQRTARS